MCVCSQVRNGSSTLPLKYKECDTTVSATVRSYSRWLWVKFKSDDTVTNTGFTANYSVVSPSGRWLCLLRKCYISGSLLGPLFADLTDSSQLSSQYFSTIRRCYIKVFLDEQSILDDATDNSLNT